MSRKISRNYKKILPGINGINDYSLSDGYSQTSDVECTRQLKAPDLPTLQLVDLNPSNLQGQIVYIDFDGEQALTYNGPVTIGPFDLPAFKAPSELAGEEQEIISQILVELEQIFAGTGILFTSSQPPQEIEYSTVYIGGHDSGFAEYGDFLGLARVSYL